MMFNPNLLPEWGDPRGSTRHNCTVIKISARGDYKLNFEDYIDSENVFVVKYLSKSNPILRIDVFDGVVLREPNNCYSYWKKI